MSEIKELPGPWIQIYSLRDHLDTCAAHISQMFEAVLVMTQNKNGEVAGDIATEFTVQINDGFLWGCSLTSFRAQSFAYLVGRV